MKRRFSRSEFTVKHTLELEVEVSGTPVPYTPAVMYLKNGDPGYPAEGGYAEDLSVFLTRKDRDGKVIKLDITDFITDQDYLSDLIMEEADSYAEGAAEAAAESDAEARRERDDY